MSWSLSEIQEEEQLQYVGGSGADRGTGRVRPQDHSEPLVQATSATRELELMHPADCFLSSSLLSTCDWPAETNNRISCTE